MDSREKNPAAVALGKRRQAKMTAEERAQFVAAGAAIAGERIRKRPPEERRAIARRSAATRRNNPPWLRNQAAPAGSSSSAPTPPAAAVAPEIAELAQSLDQMPDDLLQAFAAALAAEFPKR